MYRSYMVNDFQDAADWRVDKNKTRINTGLSFRQYEPIKGEKNKFLFELVVYLI